MQSQQVNQVRHSNIIPAPKQVFRVGVTTSCLPGIRDRRYAELVPTLESKATFCQQLANREQVNLLDALVRLSMHNRVMVSRLNSRVMQSCLLAYYLWDEKIDALCIKQFVLANFNYAKEWDFNRLFRPKDWCEQGWLERTGEKRENGNGRPATIYRLSRISLDRIEEAMALGIVPPRSRLSME